MTSLAYAHRSSFLETNSGRCHGKPAAAYRSRDRSILGGSTVRRLITPVYIKGWTAPGVIVGNRQKSQALPTKRLIMDNINRSSLVHRLGVTADSLQLPRNRKTQRYVTHLQTLFAIQTIDTLGAWGCSTSLHIAGKPRSGDRQRE